MKDNYYYEFYQAACITNFSPTYQRLGFRLCLHRLEYKLAILAVFILLKSVLGPFHVSQGRRQGGVMGTSTPPHRPQRSV